jgi:WD repeat-containing protein 70
MPKTLGKKKDSQKVTPEPVDDEYEVEQPINDPMIAMMPMSFGKQEKEKDLTARFAKTKRMVCSVSELFNSKQEEMQPKVTVNPVGDDDEDDSDDMIGPMPAEAEDLEDEDEFPISHEIVLKDHTKVVPLNNVYTDARPCPP